MYNILQNSANEKTGAFAAGFCKSYVQKDPTIFDFQKVVERHVGMPMDWFFKQWVLGTEIPKYEWNFRTEKLGKYDYVVFGAVRQQGPSCYQEETNRKKEKLPLDILKIVL